MEWSGTQCNLISLASIRPSCCAFFVSFCCSDPSLVKMDNEDIRSRYMQLVHMMIVQVSCIVAVICVLKSKSRRPQISSRVRKHRGRVRDEQMTNTSCKRPSTNHSQDAASSSTKKRAKKVVEDDTYMGDIAKSLRKIAEAFEMSTIEFIKQDKQASAEYIWAQLEDIGVEPAFLPHVYVHLVQHPVALKAFNGVPVHKRKEFLSHIVPGYSPSH